MKPLLTLLLSIVAFQVKAQEKFEEAIEIIKPQVFHVNSVSNLTGSTRQIIPIQLPKNTIKWYYTFSASRNPESVQNVQSSFNLLAQLSRVIDETGTTAKALNILSKPPGSDYCDVYLFSSVNDMKIFESKSDILGDGFSYNRLGSQENYVSGTKEISDATCLKGVQYLGFRNKNPTYGIDVCLQIVAIVNPNNKSTWTKEQKDEMFNSIKQELIKNGMRKYLDDTNLNSFIACMLSKFSKEYSPEQLESLAEYEIEELFKNYATRCDKELNLGLENMR